MTLDVLGMVKTLGTKVQFLLGCPSNLVNGQ